MKRLHCKPIPVMKTGFSLWGNSHREKPVFIAGMGLHCALNLKYILSRWFQKSDLFDFVIFPLALPTDCFNPRTSSRKNCLRGDQYWCWLRLLSMLLSDVKHILHLSFYLLGWGPSETLSHLHGILSRDAIMAQTCWKPQWNKKRSLLCWTPRTRNLIARKILLWSCFKLLL